VKPSAPCRRMNYHRHPIHLTPEQRKIVMVAANALPQQLRDGFLNQVETRLKLRASLQAVISDDILSRAIDSAMRETEVPE
jgi:hypothetical protein